MNALEQLAEEARQLANGLQAPNVAEQEVARQLQICNACRYCEGFCAVFPAMTRRLEFASSDVRYLANLCHNCSACYHACQYAPPHAFAVNIPQAMAKVRVKTYADYAWPKPLGALYRRNGVMLAVVLAFALAAAWMLVGLGPTQVGDRAHSFFALVPHHTMATVFGIAFALACLALAIGATRFWRDIAPSAASSMPALREASIDALTLRYLDGGHGLGCNEADDRFTKVRRIFHHATAYGFMLCFAATCVATIYHYVFAWYAPYPMNSMPVLLGSAGGVSMLVGCTGLLALNLQRDPAIGDAAQRPMDRGFIAMLWLAAATGLVLLVGRDGGAMPSLLAVHLGTILALFVTLPYGKFAHAAFRCAALLKFAIEKRQPNKLQLGDD